MEKSNSFLETEAIGRLMRKFSLPCAYVSLCLGAKENKKAHKTVGNAVVLCIAVSG